ncbi:MAG: M36 family metallopeptidase [Saprospiraceae bacterium]|nr:M36 family metallopeptidase [Saprospiraceae bacterium]
MNCKATFKHLVKMFHSNYWHGRNVYCILILLLFSLNFIHAQTKVDIARKFLSEKATELKLTPKDISEATILRQTYFKKADLTNVYFQQNYLGIPIYNAVLSVHIKGNQVVSWANRFCERAESKVGSSVPVLNQGNAVTKVAQHHGYPIVGTLKMMENKGGAAKEVVYDKGTLSLENIPVRLIWQPMEDGSIHLSWEVNIYERNAQNNWITRIDAITGAILNKNNLVLHCNFDAPCKGVETHKSHIGHKQEATHSAAFMAAPLSQYRVYKEPIESPNHGGRTLVSDPNDLVASPFGWHDTNGAAGPEYTITRGNNVHAYTDVNADNVPDAGSEPDGGAGLVFDFPVDLSQQPNTYVPAAVTNLFYWNSYIHDFAYKYGFDEANGNFQVNNYGRGGIGNDDVRAEAQDGGGSNNANFFTPVDGQRPRMQMFLWTTASPLKDGDFDNGVIAHEYAHGISNRFTGVGCLGNAEQMGEGWSDYYGLMTTWTGSASDRGIGTYVLNQPTNGTGIRPTKYSTNMGVNPSTYNTIKTSAIPHGVGYVWCTMLWELVNGLVVAHGSTTGFDEAMNLVNLGMAIQPCNPGFVDGRNAILAADDALYGGMNKCIIWKAFAKRGLGVSAIQGSSNSVADGTEAFDLPACCTEVTPPIIVCRDVTIMYGGSSITLLPKAPTPKELAPQTKSIAPGVCPNPATAGPMCNCPAGSVAVGYESDYGNGYGGNVNSRFRLHCRAVNPDGSFGAATSVTCYNGTATGTSNITVMANPGEALVGFRNYIGCAVDGLIGRSKTLASILALSPNSTNTVMPIAGGVGGSLQAEQLAPNGQVIVGMQTYIDAGNNISAGYAWKYAILDEVMRGITTSSDNCDSVFVSLSKSTFSCSEIGNTLVTATATDLNGNTASCTFNVSVDGPPSIGVCAANPSIYNALGRTSVFSSINLAGTGTSNATVKPGAAVSLTFNRNTTRNADCGGCCGCITQHYLGMNDGVGTVFSSCLFSTTGNSSASHVINFTAPSTPGIYYINPVASWWFSCNQFGVPTYSRAAAQAIAVLVVGCGQTDCQDITVTAAPNVCNVIVSYPSYCPSDETAGSTIAQTAGLASGVSYPVGKTMNTFKATDASGKMTTCTFSINVLASTCKYPIQVYHRDTTTSTAKIKWKAQSGTCATGGLYELRNRYELSPGVWSPWTAWVNKNTAILEHNFTGLGAGRFYHYQIHTICGPGQTSSDINGWFHTLPLPLRKENTDIADENGRFEEAQPEVDGLEKLPIKLQLAPNPAFDFTELYIQGFEKTSKEVMMFDLNGRLVFRVRISANQNNLGLDLERLKVYNGLYLIRVSDGNNQKTEQLIIER